MINADTSININKSSWYGKGSTILNFKMSGSDTSIVINKSSWYGKGSTKNKLIVNESDTTVFTNKSSYYGDASIAFKFDPSINYQLDKPQNLEAILIEKSKVSLKWDQVNFANNYRLYVSLYRDSLYKLVYSGIDTTFHDIGDHLIPATTFYYRVLANNDTSSSPLSDILEVTTLPEIHRINLAIGWNQISTYIIPLLSDSIEVLLKNIEDNLLIAKNFKGDVYIPTFSINTIGLWDLTQGYKLYMTEKDTLSISGKIAHFPKNQILLKAGWNMIAYLKNYDMPAEQAFESISKSNNLLIVKNQTGQVYIPSYDINTIGNLKPGVAYNIFVLSNDNFTYP